MGELDLQSEKTFHRHLVEGGYPMWSAAASEAWSLILQLIIESYQMGLCETWAPGLRAPLRVWPTVRRAIAYASGLALLVLLAACRQIRHPREVGDGACGRLS